MTRPKRKLINGRMMTCPRCKKDHDILLYVPLRMIEEFKDETTPIYKCPSCRWTFAPSERLLVELLERLMASNEREKSLNE
jgi:hypothetical protein